MKWIARTLELNRLAFELARRDVVGRYKGSLFGMLWAVLQPLVMLGVYTIFFTQVFKAKWGGDDTGTGTYAIALFVGIVVHGVVAESMSRGSACILSNPGYVKKIVFPIQVLPWSIVLGAMFNALIGILITVVMWALLGHGVSSGIWMWLFLLVPIALVSASVAFLAAALNVYFRDVGQIIGLLITALLFTSPVFFRADQVQGKLRVFLNLNPLTYLIEESRNLLLFDGALSVGRYAAFCLLATIFMLAVKWFFSRISSGFADVL